MKIETKDGFACELDEEALGDWEILERLIKIQRGEYADLPDVMVELIGEDGYNGAKEHCRNDRGRVPVNDLMALFFDVLTVAKETAPESKKK